MDFANVSTVVAIVVICFLIGNAAKNLKFVKDEWIPTIVGFFGGILGAVGMHVIPDYPAQDYLNAIAVGIMSGLASTGVHQLVKQTSTATK